ncbi:MAG: hypothetical protein IPJ60_19035 [Sphingobacteriaceae bacterium]|nr:hypothetical protein [Sphingobacteriaceae bacterium]
MALKSSDCRSMIDALMQIRKNFGWLNKTDIISLFVWLKEALENNRLGNIFIVKCELYFGIAIKAIMMNLHGEKERI